MAHGQGQASCNWAPLGAVHLILNQIEAFIPETANSFVNSNVERLSDGQQHVVSVRSSVHLFH